MYHHRSNHHRYVYAHITRLHPSHPSSRTPRRASPPRLASPFLNSFPSGGGRRHPSTLIASRDDHPRANSRARRPTLERETLLAHLASRAPRERLVARVSGRERSLANDRIDATIDDASCDAFTTARAMCVETEGHDGVPTVTVGLPDERDGMKGARNPGARAWESTLEPHAVAKSFDRRWVKIDGVEYDITDFKHPGGSVIYYMLSNTGADATEAFKEFHYRSKKARKALAALPRREPADAAPVEDADMLKDFAKWRKELEREGFFKPSPAHVAYRFAELATMFALGTALMYARWHVASVFVTACFFGARCGWVQHEGGHSSLTGNIWWDKRIQAFTGGFGLASSGDMWNLMHNKHHATPQKVRHDMDLDTTPAVAFFNTAVEENRPRKFSKLWLRVQAWTFVPVTSGLVLLAWMYLLHPRHIIRRKNYEEAAWIVAAHIIRTSIIKAVTGYSWVTCYGLFLSTMWVSGCYLFAHFSTSHTHLDVVPSDKHLSWVRYAVDHTIDIDPSKSVVNWLMGYLNCQVIHHLFPDMPQFRQPEVSRRFVSFAKKWNLNYKVMSYYGAWKATFGNLNDVGKHYYIHGSQTTKKTA